MEVGRLLGVVLREGAYTMWMMCVRANFYQSRGSNRAFEDQVWLWHLRLGHASFGYLEHLFPSLFSGCKPSDFKCDICILAKSHRATYLGPAPVTTTYSFHWFVLCYDIGGEYAKKVLQSYFQENGILHETTCPYTHQHNDVVERKNRQLLQIIRAILMVLTCHHVYFLNRVPTSVLQFKMRLAKLEVYVSIPSHLTLLPHVFLCVAFVHLQKHQSTKLDPCVVKCVFVGYYPHQNLVSPSLVLGESNVEELKWMEIFQDNIEVNWLAMRDVVASTEPAYTKLISTALPTTEPVNVTLLATEPFIVTPLSTISLCRCHKGRNRLVVNKFILLNINLMVLLTCIMLDLWPKVLLILM
ncbi:transposable element gene, partial [Prunus dulcis]